MPFHNPFWAEQKNPSTVQYLTLGMYPITVNITGSQTEIGSSTNTVEVSYASHTKEYWETERTIPAYTYFTLGSNVINENNVTPAADPEAPDLPHNSYTSSGSYQRIPLHLAVSSWDGHQVYNGTALTSPGTITDIVATGGGNGLSSTVLRADTVYYTGNSPCIINYTYDEDLGTLTVTAVPISLGAFNINYFTNDHSVDRTFISGSWSGGTAPYTVTVNGVELSESSSAGPGNGSTGWKATATGYGVWYDLSTPGTYTVVITDSLGASASATVEYSNSSDDSSN